MIPRFELSTEALKFYGKGKSSTEELHFYGTATAYTTEELDFYGRSSRLFPQNSYISKEQSQIYKERLQNSKETVIFLQNDTTFSSRSVVPSGPPYLLKLGIMNNHSPKLKWILVDIYRAAIAWSETVCSSLKGMQSLLCCFGFFADANGMQSFSLRFREHINPGDTAEWDHV